ncbi:DUF4135 domain-containing protein [Stackebrandtia endophytica]|nr:DUF4135 domain-containing protein [Stackebrandtia endophytica]
MSPAAASIAEAVAAGRCGAMFPSVATPIEGRIRPVRRLAGPHDAEFVAAALSAPQFRPVVDAIKHATAWCEATDGHDLVATGVLSIDNDDLFGPLFTELFTVCAANRISQVDSYCHSRLLGWLTYLESFLQHLRADRGDLADRFGLGQTIVSITAQDNETHNRGRRVLRLADAGGVTVAYKARPAVGESMFLSDDGSVFELVNSLVDEQTSELPTLTCLARGTDADSRLWQEWIEPMQREPILRRDDVTVNGPVLPTAQAPLFWSRAGALAAASMAFGIGDLIEGNIICGRRAGEVLPRYHVVDLEVFGSHVVRLSETGLITGPGPLHHVGFESRPRACTVDPPMVYFRHDDMALVRSDRSWTRQTTDTVVSDSDGRFGYGQYLPDFIRGAFDLWAILCHHRDEIGAVLSNRYGDTAVTRVLPRETGDYAHALERLLLDGQEPAGHFNRAEREQLLAGDVPYFHVTAGDPATLYTLDGPTGESPDIRFFDTDGWDLSAFGTVIRDAVLFVKPTSPDRAAGVRTGYHEVAIDWTDVDSRLIYIWDDDTVRLQVTDLDDPTGLDEVSTRLRRIDHADATLRSAWVESGKKDEDLATRLAQLCGEAALWLESVVDEHGWPTAAMVGAEAAAAACRLLQHMDGSFDFRHRCLREMTSAAQNNAVPLADVAYVTDAVRLSEGRPQLYGTKFELRNGEFLPGRLADPDGVDALRASMGMPPLAEYAEKIRQRFGHTITSPAAGAAP